MSALEGGEISAYPEYTGTALLVFFKKDAADLPKDPQAAYDEVKTGFEAEGHHRLPADAVHLLQRGRGDQGDGGQVQPEEHLRPVRGRR